MEAKRGNVTLSAAAVCLHAVSLPVIDGGSNQQWFGYALPRREKTPPEVATT